MNRINGRAIAAIGAGVAFCYSGITGRSILQSIQAIIQGKSPTTVANTTPIQGTGNPNAQAQPAGNISGGGVNGSALANMALANVGHAYLYGGAPGPNGSNPWDCSSAVSWWIGHQMSHAIPGGSWAAVTANGSQHGPATGSYNSWSGAKVIPRSQLGAGDLCCWDTHIGIALNNTQMVSALNPSLGTAVTGVENGGPGGETLTCRRIG